MSDPRDDHDLDWDIAVELAALERGRDTLQHLGCEVSRDTRAFLRSQLEKLPETPLGKATAERLTAQVRTRDVSSAESIRRLRFEHLPFVDDPHVLAWDRAFIRLAVHPDPDTLSSALARARSFVNWFADDEFEDEDVLLQQPGEDDPDRVVFARSEAPMSAAIFLHALRSQYEVRAAWDQLASNLTNVELDELVEWARAQWRSGTWGWLPRGQEVQIPPWISPRRR